MWRPKEGWNNPYKTCTRQSSIAFEDGADAILDYLFEKGIIDQDILDHIPEEKECDLL